jgi:Icc-related predicted phosphoesterase
VTSIVKVLTATDLHQVKAKYEGLAAAVKKHHPDVLALVGDFLNMIGGVEDRFTLEECADFLSRLPCRNILFVRDNHEDANWWEFAEAWSKTSRSVNALHGETFSAGPMLMVGFPCAMGDENAFLGSREPLPEEPNIWLSKLLREHGPAMRTLWLMHETPTGTRLSQKGTVVDGNPDWNGAIERFSPWLTISGHDHQTPLKNKCWHYKIGQTVCVNAGQSDSGPLHYCLVEAEFIGNRISLPSKLTVTAYPREQSLTLPERGG